MFLCSLILECADDVQDGHEQAGQRVEEVDLASGDCGDDLAEEGHQNDQHAADDAGLCFLGSVGIPDAQNAGDQLDRTPDEGQNDGDPVDGRVQSGAGLPDHDDGKNGEDETEDGADDHQNAADPEEGRAVTPVFHNKDSFSLFSGEPVLNILLLRGDVNSADGAPHAFLGPGAGIGSAALFPCVNDRFFF